MASAITAVPQPLSRVPSHEGRWGGVPPAPRGRPPVRPSATAQEENTAFQPLCSRAGADHGLPHHGGTVPSRRVTYCPFFPAANTDRFPSVERRDLGPISAEVGLNSFRLPAAELFYIPRRRDFKKLLRLTLSRWDADCCAGWLGEQPPPTTIAVITHRHLKLSHCHRTTASCKQMSAMKETLGNISIRRARRSWRKRRRCWAPLFADSNLCCSFALMYQAAELQLPSSRFWEPELAFQRQGRSFSTLSARAALHQGKPGPFFGAAQRSCGARACWQHPCLLLGMACGGGKLCWNCSPWGPCQHGDFPLACQGQPAKSWLRSSPSVSQPCLPGRKGKQSGRLRSMHKRT